MAHKIFGKALCNLSEIAGSYLTQKRTSDGNLNSGIPGWLGKISSPEGSARNLEFLHVGGVLDGKKDTSKKECTINADRKYLR